MEKITTYNNLSIDIGNVSMDKTCDFLIEDRIYYFRNNEIRGCEIADLVIYIISKENVRVLSETTCENKMNKIINYYKKNKQSVNYPIKVLLKNPDINRMIYIDSKGYVRGYEGVIEFPKEYIINLPKSTSFKATLEEIIQPLP